ncbi:retrotransposon protein, putative, ty1-copia subclass [Tanacetum coccineum]
MSSNWLRSLAITFCSARDVGETLIRGKDGTKHASLTLLLRSILDKEKLNGSNFLDWYRKLRIVLGNEQKFHHLEEALPKAPPATAIVVVRNAYTRRVAEQQEVACLMLQQSEQELTLPYTPQHNGVLERRNQTLFYMVRSMMSLTTLPMSFWGYALESVASILNMVVPTMKVNKIPYPKETMDCYFYYPLENKIFVAGYAEFFETRLITQEASGSTVDFDEIQRQDAQPSEKTSQHQHEVEHDVVDPQTDEHELGDHGEPPNYRAALLDPESKKWLKAINAEMQSMKDNHVWNLVDLPPNCKTVGSKWLLKKKTDMDGNIHTYKARLVAKGFTQTYRVNYEETLSLIADIKAIRILIAIAAYYDNEIWQMDVKTSFLNGHLNEDVYMVQPEGFVNPKHPRRMDTSKRGTIAMQPNVDLSKSQGPSTPAENPGKSHWTAVKNILKYLRNTKDVFLVYGGDSTTELSVTCYTNASWETNRDDLRSQMGYVFVMNGGTIDWKISKLGVVPSIDEPMDMYYDNTSAITIADKPGVQKGAKHF